MRHGAWLGGCLLLVACAGVAPRGHDAGFALRLTPASLGHDLALQQQLVVESGGERRTFDALLEADVHEVRLDIQALGRSALRIRWDGQHLDQQRAPWLPTTVQGAAILDDLQLANWPAAAIRAALPAGWSLVEDGSSRELRHGDSVVATVHHPAPDRTEIERAGYRLGINSLAIGQPVP